MIVSLEKETKKHGALVELVHQLMHGIDKSFLFRTGQPVVVLVDGDENSGKKYFLILL